MSLVTTSEDGDVAVNVNIVNGVSSIVWLGSRFCHCPSTVAVSPACNSPATDIKTFGFGCHAPTYPLFPTTRKAQSCI